MHIQAPSQGSPDPSQLAHIGAWAPVSLASGPKELGEAMLFRVCLFPVGLSQPAYPIPKYTTGQHWDVDHIGTIDIGMG